MDSSPSPVRTLLCLALSRPAQFLLAGLVSGAVVVLGWSVPYLVQNVIDRRNDLTVIMWITVGIATGLILRHGLSVVRRRLQKSIVRTIERNLALKYLAHALRLDARSYEKYPSSDLLNRLHGLEHVRHALEERVLGISFDAILVAVAAILVARHSIPLAALALAGAALPAIVVFFIKRSIRDSFKETQRLSAQVSESCIDALDGVRDLRIAAAEDWFLRRLEGQYLALHDERYRHHSKLDVIGSGTGLLSALLNIAVLLAGAYAVHADRLTSGQMMFAFTMAGSMVGPLEGIVISWLFFEDAAGALERYEEIMTLPAERGAPSAMARRVEGRLRLENVTFEYLPGAPVLRGITLDISPGRSVAVVGESGAGKSTLLGLLAGFYEPGEGRILVDEEDLHRWDARAWRDQIGVVLQSPHLFRASVEDNLVLGREAVTSEDLDRATSEACAREFLSQLPEGLGTRVSAGGTPFSGGQAQRLALARALVKNPRVLLLDEATSNLDLATESAVWAALEGARGKRTTVFVTHRLSSSARADEIVVLDAGKVVERGTFRELIRANGRFADLWKRQQAEDIAGPAPAAAGTGASLQGVGLS